MKKTFLLLLTVLTLIEMPMYAQENNRQGNETLIVIHTDYGDMTAMLYNETPKHRDNFIKLVKEGWYENSPFHRVIKDFMIQGGSNADGRPDPGYLIDAEFTPKYFHKKGALAAARMGDNVNPDKKSSGSQFYIVHGQKFTDSQLNMYGNRLGKAFSKEQSEAYKSVGGTPHLDGEYTVFGEVIQGLDVIDKIAAVQTEQPNKPVKDVNMTIEILE